MLALGLISVFWGVLLALLQQDLKVLLAYSSIENVGLILIGIAVAVIGRGLQLPIVFPWTGRDYLSLCQPRLFQVITVSWCRCNRFADAHQESGVVRRIGR